MWFLKVFFVPVIDRLKGDCRFLKVCSFYSCSSFTCSHGGGSYCGQYRKYIKDGCVVGSLKSEEFIKV